MNRSTASHPPPGAGRAVAATVAVLGAIAFSAYFVVMHRLIVGGTEPALTLALIVAPWIVAGLSSLARRRIASAATTFAIAAIVVASAAVAGRRAGEHVEALLYLENLLFVLSFAWLFAYSLGGGRQPLVTRLAQLTRGGDMPAAVVSYTRKVTVAWALFFAVEAIVSTFLFFTQSREHWSVFVNLLQWPLVIVGFAFEYLVRLRVLRGIRHTSPMQGFRSFARRDELAVTPSDRGNG